jgi:hypothetical protein
LLAGETVLRRAAVGPAPGRALSRPGAVPGRADIGTRVKSVGRSSMRREFTVTAIAWRLT